MDEFRSTMARTLSQELRGLKDKLMVVIEEAFKESERSIKEYMQAEELKLAGDLVRIKEALQKEQARVEIMKEEINQPQWRKVAG